MSDFKWKHFQGEIILGCVPWYHKACLGEKWKVDETNVRIQPQLKVV